MSFGFSVGDFLAGAQLAYTLCKALSDAKGSAREFQELITQLDVVHKVLLQVDQLRATNQLAQSTINALLFTVNSANETMESFLDQNEPYLESLKAEGSGYLMKDVYRKLKWPMQMPERVKALKRSLATMLAAINCLVSLACYYNTGYDPRCTAKINPHYTNSVDYGFPELGIQAGDIKIATHLSYDASKLASCPGFAQQDDQPSFFRPGQIFAVQIVSSLFLSNDRGFREVDFGHLPLDSILKLQVIANMDRLEDRQKRLAQIRKLPLSQMTVHCRDVLFDRQRVQCLLCKGTSYLKEAWTFHFQLEHWDYYFSMVPENASLQLYYEHKVNLVPRDEIARASLSSSFSADKWLTIDDITDDVPILTDFELAEMVNRASIGSRNGLAGPVMIQRFVVIRERASNSLCVGIHTYARKGCGSQPDQELFSIIHTGKEPPTPFSDETGLILSPIRMKPHHPSTTLPRSARIHFGRAYEIVHQLPVQPLGLVHPTSMETLLDQFDANIFRHTTDKKQVSTGIPSGRDPFQVEALDDKVKVVDMEIVKEVRNNITKVLGSRLSLADNQPTLSNQRIEPNVLRLTPSVI